MATGIKDKIVILGMGCSKFGERWDANAEDLMVEAFEEATKDAGVGRDQIEAAWFGTAIEDQHVGKSGVPLAMTLRLPYIFDGLVGGLQGLDLSPPCHPSYGGLAFPPAGLPPAERASLHWTHKQMGLYRRPASPDHA